MASTKHSSLSFLLITLVTLVIFSNPSSCNATGAISVYWGQGPNDEGTLKETCATGNYDIVIIDGLVVYDDGSDPTLNLRNHCNPCTSLQSQIKYCQNEKNVKVFISINIDVTASPTEGDESVAPKLAEYLLNNYLSGKSGPLGSVTLDGVDIEDVPDSTHLKWADLVKAINASTTERKIYLSSSPQCIYPDYYLGDAIDTGLFDYIWVEFYYGNPCVYSTSKGADALLSAWDEWTSSVPDSLIFLGLPASESVVGYIPPEELESLVLPTAKEASNYGGVMIWDRYADSISNYSAQIRESVISDGSIAPISSLSSSSVATS